MLSNDICTHIEYKEKNRVFLMDLFVILLEKKERIKEDTHEAHCKADCILYIQS